MVPSGASGFSGGTPPDGLGRADRSQNWLRIFESYTGAWQQNQVLNRETILTYHAVYTCLSLIASDIAKLPVNLIREDGDGIWRPTTSPAYSPVIRRPNHYQNRIQFWETWLLSKLSRGNTYGLKERDARGVVIKVYVLDPDRTIPMIADDGSVWYQLMYSRLAGLLEPVLVPAREIIHDRMNCIYHPLIGTSPVWAAAIAATQGMAIQAGSAAFFANASQPGGILTAPGAIGDNTALRLKATWETNFTGANAGRVAVLGDGLKYERLALTSVEAQLIEQLKWTAEVVCSTFHVPPYKIGLGAMPTNNNVQALNVEYYSQCLQSLIEAAELCFDEGLEMAADLGVEFDVENLLRMDSVTQMNVLKEGIGAAIYSPNEARAKLDLPPVEGGETPYLQQQNYSLSALARRDADGPAPASPGPGGSPAEPATPDDPGADAAGDPSGDDPNTGSPSDLQGAAALVAFKTEFGADLSREPLHVPA
jgi:HK97 family phage portal protein